MTPDVSFIAGGCEIGMRIDAAIAQRLEDVSRSEAGRLCEAGKVTIDGEVARKSRKVTAGQRISLALPDSDRGSAAPEDLPLDIVYQDNDLVIIDKPAGLVVHPAAGHRSGTLANALASRFPGIVNVGERQRPGIVHRLDKDTSGLMVVALTPRAHRDLQQQIASRTAERRYLAVATGRLEPASATIRAPLGRDPRNRNRMSIDGIAARAAETSYTVLEYLDGFTYLEAKLHTGRTHQIRVHLMGMGHPLVGDRMYGGAEVPGLSRQFLHAHYLSLTSPSTGQRLNFSSTLPPDLSQVRERLAAVTAASEHRN